MSKTSQRKKQMYAKGLSVGLGLTQPDYRQRSSVQGWREYDRGVREGRSKKRERERKKTTWFEEKWLLIKTLFRWIMK